MKIISGGQTGADRAALDAAIKLKLPYGGWLPRGRKTENGPLPTHYNLKELDSENYRTRTEQNVIAGDGTLILSFGPLTGGSALTESLSIKHDRPCLILNLALITLDEAVVAIEKWIQRYEIAIMNVAGARASGEPRIYDAVYKLLLQINWKLINT